MRRLVALGLIVTVVEFAGLSAILHTHAYNEHDHPEHHHGLAAHSHHEQADDVVGHDDHDSLKWTRCDPGVHRTSVRFVSSTPVSLDVVFGSAEQPFTLVATPDDDSPMPHVDVRAHGPPVRSHTPSRAPPVIALRAIT